jgi:hypothetical protein
MIVYHCVQVTQQDSASCIRQALVPNPLPTAMLEYLYQCHRWNSNAIINLEYLARLAN